MVKFVGNAFNASGDNRTHYEATGSVMNCVFDKGSFRVYTGEVNLSACWFDESKIIVSNQHAKIHMNNCKFINCNIEFDEEIEINIENMTFHFVDTLEHFKKAVNVKKVLVVDFEKFYDENCE